MYCVNLLFVNFFLKLECRGLLESMGNDETVRNIMRNMEIKYNELLNDNNHKTTIIDRLNVENNYKTTLINDYVNSNSWKITAPLRSLKKMFTKN